MFDVVSYFPKTVKSSADSVCRVAVEYPSKVTEEGTLPCHALFTFQAHNYEGLTGIYSSLWRSSEVSQEDAWTYWSFIFDPKVSPWRDILVTKDGRSVEIFYHKDVPIAFKLPIDEHSSSQLVCNLLVASRIPLEHPYSIALFIYALRSGLSLAEAQYLSAHFYLKNNQVVEAWSGHFPFNVHSNIRLERLVNGTPELNKNLIQAGDTPEHVNIIWDGEGSSKIHGLVRKATPYVGAFPRAFKLQSYNGLFFDKGVIPDPETVIRLFKENRAQL